MSAVPNIVSLIKNASKAGNLMFRIDPNPAELFRRGNTLSDFSNFEPAGLYFAKNIKDLPDLISPHVTRDINVKDALVALVKKGKAKPSGCDVARPAFVIRAAPLEPDKVLNLTDPKKFVNMMSNLAFDYAFERRLSKELAREYSKRIRDLEADPYIELARPFADFPKYVANTLQAQGVHGMEFPDVVTGQFNRNQVAMFKPRATAAMYKGGAGLLSLLGLTGNVFDAVE